MGFAFDSVAGPTPRLSIVRNGNQVTISWDASLAGWTLESASELPATSWSPVPGVTGNSITLNLAPGNAFYRLRK